MKKILIKEKPVNTRKSMAHKAVLTAVCLTCALSISACGKRSNTNQNKDPLTGVTSPRPMRAAAVTAQTKTALKVVPVPRQATTAILTR